MVLSMKRRKILHSLIRSHQVFSRQSSAGFFTGHQCGRSSPKPLNQQDHVKQQCWPNLLFWASLINCRALFCLKPLKLTSWGLWPIGRTTNTGLALKFPFMSAQEPLGTTQVGLAGCLFPAADYDVWAAVFHSASQSFANVDSSGNIPIRSTAVGHCPGCSCRPHAWQTRNKLAAISSQREGSGWQRSLKGPGDPQLPPRQSFTFFMQAQ